MSQIVALRQPTSMSLPLTAAIARSVARVGALTATLAISACLALTFAVPVGASSAGDNADRIVDRALRISTGQPGCSGRVTPPLGRTTDQAPPPEVLRRYGIFRSPQPSGEPLAPLTNTDDGLLATAYQRTRTVAGIRVTVAPLLDWTPTVRPRSCDAFVLRRVRVLVRKQPRSVQRRALAIVNRQRADNEAIRRLPLRTLLLLGAPDALSPTVTGALALSAQRGLFMQVGQTAGRATFVGLVPDGVSRIRFRTGGESDVEVPITDNIAVVRTASDRLFGPGRQTVWLNADDGTVRTIGSLTTHPN